MDRQPGNRPKDGQVRAAPDAVQGERETDVIAALSFAGLFVVAAAIQAYLIRALDGPAAPDAASSVLYFQRIIAGRHLEAFVNTTPKPLLTVIYGTLVTRTHDWRLISLATVAAAGCAVVLGAELARRLGGIAAGAFAFVALAGLPSFLGEVSWAYGLPYAMALWFAAALALVRDRPRYGLAGLFLFVAALARPETYIVLGLATVAIGVAWLRDRDAARHGVPLLVGWLALVGMGIHDWLLTGDPMWWATVAATNAAATPGQRLSIGGVLRETLDRTRALGLTAVLAVVGTAILFSRRRWTVLVGLVALGPVVVLEGVFFAWRGLDVLGHYLHSVDVVAVIAASVTVGAGVDVVIAALRMRAPRDVGAADRSVAGALAVVAAAVVAVAITPFAPLSAPARASLGRQAQLAVDERRVLPALECAIGRGRGSGCIASPAPDGLKLYLPSLQLIRFTVDLDIPVTRATTLNVARLRQGAGYPPPDSLVHLDRRGDVPAVEQASAWLRVISPTDVANVHLVPLFADPTDGLWVVRIDPASSR
jgi:hypothetical protein